jgi:hypothetical protein
VGVQKEPLYNHFCLHKLLFENKMSIWLRNRAGGVQLDKEGKILKFSLSIIHGSREGLSFAATHPTFPSLEHGQKI